MRVFSIQTLFPFAACLLLAEAVASFSPSFGSRTMARRNPNGVFRSSSSPSTTSLSLGIADPQPLWAMLRGGAKVTSKSSISIPPMVQKILATAVSVPIFLFRQFQSMSRHQKLTALVFLLAGVFLGRSTVNPFWKRYTAVVDIPSHLFGSKAPVLHGRAVTVSDGDTIRFLHTPTPFHPKGLLKGEKASKIALPIRICTIDTPETAKFGKSGQPFGIEAKETLKSLLENKTVKIRLLQADQYGRGVAQVFTGRNNNADEAMLKAGMAEVYQGGGAVYGPLGLEAYLDLEQEAKKQKLGIWSTGKRESAAEYKRRTK